MILITPQTHILLFKKKIDVKDFVHILLNYWTTYTNLPLVIRWAPSHQFFFSNISQWLHCVVWNFAPFTECPFPSQTDAQGRATRTFGAACAPTNWREWSAPRTCAAPLSARPGGTPANSVPTIWTANWDSSGISVLENA